MFSGYPDIMTVKDVQCALQIGKNAVYRLIETGELRAFRIDGKSLRVIKSDLIAYIDKKVQQGVTNGTE